MFRKRGQGAQFCPKCWRPREFEVVDADKSSAYRHNARLRVLHEDRRLGQHDTVIGRDNWICCQGLGDIHSPPGQRAWAAEKGSALTGPAVSRARR